MYNRLETLFIGRNFIKFDEIDSTNSYLKLIAEKENTPEGTVVVADFQSMGRGQRGTQWESGKGKNILFSVLLCPRFVEVNEQFIISQAVALAVYDLVNFFLPGFQVYIKWPNDILVEGKKVAGILIENNLVGNEIKNAIAGIGININQEKDLLPEAASFAGITGQTFNIEEVTFKLCSFIEARYLFLKSGNHAQLRYEYLQKLFGFRQINNFEEVGSGKCFTGIIKGVSISGKLQLLVEDELKEYDLKEIKMLFTENQQS